MEKNTFTLRPATPADVPAIMDVMHTAMAAIKDPEWFFDDTAEYIAEHIDGPLGFCLVAEAEDGTLASYFTVKIPGNDEDALGRLVGYDEAELQRCAQVDSCCVAPRYQGNGLEGRLLLAAEDRMRTMPYDHYLGTVHPDNAASLNTVLHRGYRIAVANARVHGGQIRHVVQKDVIQTEETKE